MKRLTQDDYTVAWYCPLAVPELQAARLLFDEEHQQISFPQSPRFLYIYGEICGHNVVMATAPETDIGTISAAQVTFEMQTFHPRLKFCLLVGIGGAVPRPHSRDVRLGDVVVSIPDREAQHGGVIQYDYGKAKQDGVFQRIGSLNRPDATLLNAVSLFRSSRQARNSFHEYLRTYQTIDDGDAENDDEDDFQRPLEDVLFQSSYHHEGKVPCEKLGCDRKQEVARDPRRNKRPVVHYGTIASGNSVIKDSRLRDRLGEEDESILCFEMEAAGIMKSFPSLAIRGMCDYCDSHKNCQWQPFAAAVAASLAKAILSVIPAEKVRHMKDMLEVTRVNKHWLVPRMASPQFTGYVKVFQHLEERLGAEPGGQADHRQKVFVISGMGGVGKSEIVLQFAEKYRESLWGVFWVDCDSVLSATTDFKRIAHECVWPVQENAVAIDEVKRHLSNSAHDSLLVLDNCDDENINFAKYIPSGNRVHVIITTRLSACEQLASQNDTGLKDHESLKRLDRDSAIDLALKVAKIGFPTTESQKIAASKMVEVLDCHPLAIVIGAALVSDGMYSLEEYPDVFSKRQEQLLKQRPRQMESRHKDVYTTFEVSAQALEASSEPIAKHALGLLEVLSYMDRRNITEDIFTRAWEHEDIVATDTVERDDIGHLSSWHVTRSKLFLDIEPVAERVWAFRQARALLCRLSLATLDKDASSLSMHSLVNAWAALRIGRQRRSQVWATSASILAFSAQESLRYGPFSVQLQPHIEMCVTAYLETDYPLADNERKQYCTLLFILSWQLHQVTSAKTLLTVRRLKESSSKLGGWSEEGVKSIRIQHLLGACLLENRLDLEAIELLEHVVEVEKALPENHPDRLASQHELAYAYNNNGQITEAIELLEHVVEVKKALPENHLGRLASQHMLACAYNDNGQITEAIELLEHVVEVEKALPENHLDRLASQHMLACAYNDNGQITEAIELLEHVVEVEKALPENHPDRLGPQHELAYAYSKIGQTTEGVARESSRPARFAA